MIKCHRHARAGRRGHVAAALSIGVALAGPSTDSRADSIARVWNEQQLAAIRIDLPHPPAHARNLFHVSVAMYDAWAAYDPIAIGYIHNEDAVAPGGDVAAARVEAISYAAYRVLRFRYQNSQNAATTAVELVSQMLTLGYDPGNETTAGTSPAAVGNRVAAAVLGFASTDHSNELNGYEDLTYEAVNDPLPLEEPGFTLQTVHDPNRWQPITFGDFALTQNGLEADKVQTFLGSHWRDVRPFAMHRDEPADVYHDPGMPPQLGGVGDDAFKDNINQVLRFSSWLDPDDGAMINLSPAVRGNNPLGQNDGVGHGATNPVTSLPYADNIVNRADYGRVIAEFWADGPHSETPPGHWNTLANDVTDDPLTVFQIGGSGAAVDELEWDVKRYFAMNAAMHDAATAAWTCKRQYDYVRPITMARYMGLLGQSSDPGDPMDPVSWEAFTYDPDGLKLEPGLVEIITPESSAAGERHEHLAEFVPGIAIYTWGGEPADPETEYTGSEWIHPMNWLPYQRDTFVTPAFAGYVSGHSCFSRAGAEVMTRFTGSPYFPGGLGEYTEPAGALEFEAGPTSDVTLQWATYYDAADEAGISRLYGGIHVAPDDGPGRVIGSKVGIAAYQLAEKYWDGSILEQRVGAEVVFDENASTVTVTWFQDRGLFYKVQSSADLASWTDETGFVRAEDDAGTFAEVVPDPDGWFYRVLRNSTGN